MFDFTRINIYNFPIVFAAVLNIFLAGVIYLKNRKNVINRYFSLFCLVIGLYCLIIYFYRISIEETLAFSLARWAYLVMIFIPYAFIGFVLYFIAFKEWAKYIVNSILFLCIIFVYFLFRTPYFFSRVEYVGGPHFYKITTGVVYSIFVVVFAASALLGSYLLFTKYKTEKGYKRSQFLYLILAALLGGGLATIGMVFIVLGKIRYYSLPYIGAAVYAFLVAYAITRHRLMDIQIAIRKTAAYSILTVLLTGIFLSFILIGEYFFRGFTGYSSLWVAITLAFVSALVFQPLRYRVQALIDRLFFKGKYDYQKTIKNLSHMASSAVDLENLLNAVSKRIEKELRINQSAFYILDQGDKIYKLKETQINEA
ncbi:histidine kinase N-terminal 7TM domain-containing protein [Candidatus Margulisiibacteriota bacterium]